jgi:hypothetical protein
VGNALVNVVEGYMIETGRRTVTPELAENTVYNPDLSYTWYVDYFKGKGTIHPSSITRSVSAEPRSSPPPPKPPYFRTRKLHRLRSRV